MQLEWTQADSALSHLMKIMYISRLCHGDVVTTTGFLARRVHWWSLNDDRRLHRLMSYIHHHTELCLWHQPHPKGLSEAFLDFSPDAELGGDPLHDQGVRQVLVGVFLPVWE